MGCSKCGPKKKEYYKGKEVKAKKGYYKGKEVKAKK